MDNNTELSLAEIVEGLRQGDFSCREIVQGYLQRIDKFDGLIHAFLYVDREGVLKEAERADQRLLSWRKNDEDSLPPLFGVPLAVKDVLTVAGMPCTAGSKILERFVPPYDATVVARLRSAGVVILGKTNTDEFAMGSSTENSAYGVTHNPWDLKRVPGGSSGGSAAAVASRMTPLALGTDTGGSVRQPAAFCGVSGIKPTYGRVSRYGLIAYGSSFDTAGVLAPSVEALLPLYQVMAGFDPLDATSVDLPVEVPTGLSDVDLHGLRIGVPKEYFTDGIQEEVSQAIENALRVFEELGASLTEISLPHTQYAVPVYYIIAPAEASANLARYDGMRYSERVDADSLWEMFRQTRGQLFGSEVKRRIMLGTYALSAGYYDAYYAKAQKVRWLIKEEFVTAFKKVDLIAAPVAPTTAFRIGEHRDDPLSMYLEDIFTLPANLSGIPGLSLPVGFDRDGLPIGMQLMASHFNEKILFCAGLAYQSVTDWHSKVPNLNIPASDNGKSM